ncbi:DUF887-domain-containing protein [Coemansia reversa NRRL 1564]|uniref:DUF887-domain-containing protein n=1 Tax=Coemansia reversa (strain ATCC 12441 / NRRL 1564) TaxID=763665 RepID=A0A2G5B5Y5_COERN|nr:DUF887-domain-containing protein [Coemansia reversa NRRL 1564]|eukprot:PIA14426.1 DUF887-domain-containing protein [Coemansia reversa NRRL 1564]
MSLVTNYQRLVNLPTAQALCIWLGLPKLAPYWPALVALAILFQLLRLSSNTLSSLVFGSRFDALTTRQKYDWGVRFVSQVHAIVVVIFAVPILFNKELSSDKLYGFSSYAAGVYTIVCGYFLWDICVSISDVKRLGLGFVLHAIASFGVYILSFRPSLQYYGASFIMFEASTIFLNINWWLDKLGMTGSRLQLYNASALLSLYLIVRILFGTFMSYSMFKDLDTKGTQTPVALYYFYRLANHTVLALSYYWFYLMIVAVKKRFPPARDAELKKIE